MALINSHTVLNALLIVGAAFVALVLLRTAVRVTLRVFSVGCLVLVVAAVVVGIVRWVA